MRMRLRSLRQPPRRRQPLVALAPRSSSTAATAAAVLLAPTPVTSLQHQVQGLVYLAGETALLLHSARKLRLLRNRTTLQLSQHRLG